MKRCAALMLALFCGCGGDDPVPSTETAKTTSETPVTDAQAPVASTGTMTNTEVFLFDAEPVPGETRKPRVALKAAVFKRLESGVWAFEKAQAVMRGSGEGSEITFEAAEGQYEENKSAFLRGGVKAQAGTMSVELQDIQVDSL